MKELLEKLREHWGTFTQGAVRFELQEVEYRPGFGGYIDVDVARQNAADCIAHALGLVVNTIEDELEVEGCDCECFDAADGSCQHGDGHGKDCEVDSRCVACRIDAKLTELRKHVRIVTEVDPDEKGGR